MTRITWKGRSDRVRARQIAAFYIDALSGDPIDELTGFTNRCNFQPLPVFTLVSNIVTQSSGKSPKACSSLETMSARGSRSDNAERLVERAIDAYLKTFPMGCSLPFSSDSVVVLDGVDRLVVLRNGKRTLAVYRVSAAGALLPQPRESLPKQFLE